MVKSDNMGSCLPKDVVPSSACSRNRGEGRGVEVDMATESSPGDRADYDSE
jgi:hypothetical protein